MKRTNDLIIKRYVKQVLQLTPDTYRSRLKKELKNSIFECFHNTPDLTESMICEHFGTPQHFAANYLASMDADDLQSQIVRSRRQKKALMITLIILCILLVPIFIWICNEGNRHVGYYYSEERIEYLSPRP